MDIYLFRDESDSPRASSRSRDSRRKPPVAAAGDPAVIAVATPVAIPATVATISVAAATAAAAVVLHQGRRPPSSEC